MRAMQADKFGGYGDLRLVDVVKPEAAEGRFLVRMIGAGVTPLDHTILSGSYPPANAPLILGNEGAGEIVAGGDADFPLGSHVMFTGPYGVLENGTYCEYVSVRKQNLCLVPENILPVEAAGLPVAYATAYLALRAAGFEAGKTVLAPAIGGSVGNAVTQVARALGAKHAISSTTSHEKAVLAAALGFSKVVDLTQESLSSGLQRLTGGRGADIVIDSVAGETLSEALGVLAPGGSLTTLGYSGGRQSTIDVTNLIWKGASIRSFLLFTQTEAAWIECWTVISELLKSGEIKPIIARQFALEDAAEAIRYLIEKRPFGRVLLAL